MNNDLMDRLMMALAIAIFIIITLLFVLPGEIAKNQQKNKIQIQQQMIHNHHFSKLHKN